MKRVLTGCLTAILAVALLCIGGSVVWVLIFENAQEEKRDVCVPIEAGAPLSAEALDRFIRGNWPDLHEDLALTQVSLYGYAENGAFTEGTLTLDYYRFINEWRKGGNVEVRTFTLDLATRTVTGDDDYRGPSVGGIAGVPISPEVAGFPLELYAAHAAELCGVDPAMRLQLYCVARTWLDVFIHDGKEDSAVAYRERLAGWNGGAFEERTLAEP